MVNRKWIGLPKSFALATSYDYSPFTIYHLLSFGEYLRRLADVASCRRNNGLCGDINLLAFLDCAANVILTDEVNRFMPVRRWLCGTGCAALTRTTISCACAFSRSSCRRRGTVHAAGFSLLCRSRRCLRWLWSRLRFTSREKAIDD